jgi:pimeloyl-ACP methyl ester carboxylesterase
MQGHPFDEPGVSESVRHVAALIESEVAAGIPAERIVLGGFSQGGHVALKAALTHPARLAGCVALSTWLEPSRTMKASERAAGRPCGVVLGPGLVACAGGRASSLLLGLWLAGQAASQPSRKLRRALPSSPRLSRPSESLPPPFCRCPRPTWTSQSWLATGLPTP